MFICQNYFWAEIYKYEIYKIGYNEQTVNALVFFELLEIK